MASVPKWYERLPTERRRKDGAVPPPEARQMLNRLRKQEELSRSVSSSMRPKLVQLLLQRKEKAGGQLVLCDGRVSNQSHYARTELGFNGSLSPFTNPSLLTDDLGDFSFIFRSKRIGKNHEVIKSPQLERPLSAFDPVLDPTGESTREPSMEPSLALGAEQEEASFVRVLPPSPAHPSIDRTPKVRASTIAGGSVFEQPCQGHTKKGVAHNRYARHSPAYSKAQSMLQALPATLEATHRRLEVEWLEAHKAREAINSQHRESIARIKSMARPYHRRATKIMLTDIALPKRSAALCRALFQWAIGQVLLDNERKRLTAILAAKREIDTRRKEAQAAARARAADSRRHIAQEFFAEVTRKLKSGRLRMAILTEQRYNHIRHDFLAIIGSDSEVLTNKDVQELAASGHSTIDLLEAFRKVDRDHTGSVSLDDLLHTLFPMTSLREISILRGKWDANSAADHRTDAEKDCWGMLTQESRDAIVAIFRYCDKQRRGALTRSDLNVLVPNPEWQKFLDLDAYFPTNMSVLSLTDFAAITKYGFPPYCELGPGSLKILPVPKLNPLPKELIEVQERATSSI